MTKRLGFIVIDECDRMLTDTLQGEVKQIVSILKERCVKPPKFLMMTATYDNSVRETIVVQVASRYA